MITRLYSDPTSHYSHRVRIALQEKDVAYEEINVQGGQPDADFSEEILELNPNGNFPFLYDHDISLDDSTVILEYIEERFPHPVMLPVYPRFRARCREWIRIVDADVSPRVNRLMNSKTAEKNREIARKELMAYLTQWATILKGYKFIMGGICQSRENDQFSLADCYLFPILWRLERMGVDIPNTKSGRVLKEYFTTMLRRDSIRLSLSPMERKMRKTTAGHTS